MSTDTITGTVVLVGGPYDGHTFPKNLNGPVKVPALNGKGKWVYGYGYEKDPATGRLVLVGKWPEGLNQGWDGVTTAF
jgi:hypothetical protein